MTFRTQYRIFVASMTFSDYTDPELGNIRLRANPRARNITCRYAQKGELHVTVPPYITRKQLEEALDHLRPRLLKQLQRAKEVRRIDELFTLDSPYLRLKLERTEGTHFQLRTQKEEEGHTATFTLLIPWRTDLYLPGVQESLHKIITEIIRKRAKEVLPPLLSQLAHTHGFMYSKTHIHNSHTRWGSCSSQKNISLSLYLVLLPQELVHYVLLHELCHTVEMNHGPRFWNLLDRCTGNRAKTLRHLLRNYHTSF